MRGCTIEFGAIFGLTITNLTARVIEPKVCFLLNVKKRTYRVAYLASGKGTNVKHFA